jgi:hypothetical protein
MEERVRGLNIRKESFPVKYHHSFWVIRISHWLPMPSSRFLLDGILHRSSYLHFCNVSLSVALGAAGRWASIFLGCDKFVRYNTPPRPMLYVMCLVGCSPDTSDCGGWKSIPYADRIARKCDSLLLVYRLLKHLLYIENHMAFTCSPPCCTVCLNHWVSKGMYSTIKCNYCAHYLRNWLCNTLEHNLAWEINSGWAGQEIPSICATRKFI